MEAEPGPDSASSTLPLLQVGLGGPDGGVVGHVVVGGEELHLLPVDRLIFKLGCDISLNTQILSIYICMSVLILHCNTVR